MKIKISILVLIIMVICFSCDSPIGTSVEKTNNGIKTIDSCEYIEYDYGIFDQRVYSLTHKGNCKYCNERLRKLILEMKK
ncbi:hypothetical protein M0Q97_07460 [Candidatus Dojkabacteria bacterium]|jgi:hypothetical protein|nr:hypothetical protein [Candidatus Dojkabacteria bacterium]